MSLKTVVVNCPYSHSNTEHSGACLWLFTLQSKVQVFRKIFYPTDKIRLFSFGFVFSRIYPARVTSHSAYLIFMFPVLSVFYIDPKGGQCQPFDFQTSCIQFKGFVYFLLDTKHIVHRFYITRFEDIDGRKLKILLAEVL